MVKKICAPGEVIFREGDVSTEAYWIVSGRVEITIHSGSADLPVARLSPGEIFGEMGLIDNKPRAATATALGSVELEVMTEEEFEKDVLHQPARMLTYLGRLFERLRSTVNLLELERARHQTSVETTSTPESLPPAGDEDGSEPAVSLASVAPNPVTGKIITINVDRFPFRIGRARDKWSPFFQNEFSIPDGHPLQISRQHASIDSGVGKCFVTDRGSHLGTVVNGVHIGIGAGQMVAELKVGDNTVIFGEDATSPHLYTVKVSAGR